MANNAGCIVTFDKNAIKARFNKGESLAKAAVMEQVLKDSNYYCRQDQGTLIASSQWASNPKAGYVAWDTPYAKRVYYTGKPSKDVNANAELMWFEKAKSKFMKDWAAIAESFIKKEV